MGLIENLNRAAQEAGKAYLIIGGYAVNAHGYARLTADLDLLVRKVDKPFWIPRLLENGYSIYREGDTFVQFSPGNPGQIPVDFMLVNDTTFANLALEAVERTLHGQRVHHPSLLHLIALKLHVVKQKLPHRELRDLHDVLELVRINRVDTHAAEFKKFASNTEIRKFMTPSCGEPGELGKKIADCQDLAALDLPIDTDYLNERPPPTPDALFLINLERMPYLNARPGAEEARFRSKCDVEFIL